MVLWYDYSIVITGNQSTVIYMYMHNFVDMHMHVFPPLCVNVVSQ